MSDTPATPSSAPAGDDKTIAMLAYLTPLLCGVGIIIAILMHNKNKTQLGAYHLRQSLGLLIVGIAVAIVFTIIGTIARFIPGIGGLLGMGVSLVNVVVGVGLFALWVIGLLSALKCEQKPVPVLGAPIQQKLGTLFT